MKGIEMNVREIVKQWLKDNGYDGLWSDDCGCQIDDLMPCCDYCTNCKPGYKHEEEKGGEYDYTIRPYKQEDTDKPDSCWASYWELYDTTTNG
jgi:hypothetical protein